MHNKLFTTCMALAAIAAITVPPSASAANEPEVTFPTGTRLATGSLIDSVNAGSMRMTDASGNTLMECTTGAMTGELTKNAGLNVESKIIALSFTGTGASVKCTAAFGDFTVTTNPATNGLPWCLRSSSGMAEDEFQIRGNECGKAQRAIRFELDLPLGATCTYQRASAILGTFTTHPEDAILTISKVDFPLLEGSFVCPSKGFLDMSFTLETDETGEPLYIS